MSSIAAKEVGKKVLETLGKGKKVSLGKIAKEFGYAQNTADNPKNITETKSYKEIVDPALNMMIEERLKALKEIKARKLNKVQYERLINAIDTLTKNIQLLGGKPTENKKFLIGNILDELEK